MKRTIRQFATEYAQANGEPLALSRIRAWVKSGHLPTYPEPVTGQLITEADPATFRPPKRGMPPAAARNGYLTITEVARLTGHTRAAVHNAATNGKYPGARQNKKTGRWEIPADLFQK